MSSKLIKNIEQVTQSVESVVELLKYLGKSVDPLPDAVRIEDGAQLTKSCKGDCYYYTSLKGCSCPGFFYRHKCKHIKGLAGSSSKPRGQTIEETLEEHDRNLWKMPASYRRMVRNAREEAEGDDDLDRLIKRGGFKPVYPGDKED
jgi:hypothetical protein